MAPLPNALFSHCGADEFSSSAYETSGPVDLGRFITSTIVVTGFALPIVLAHSEIIRPSACVMSTIGGAYVDVLVQPNVLISFKTPDWFMAPYLPTRRLSSKKKNLNEMIELCRVYGKQQVAITTVLCFLPFISRPTYLLHP
jgi:hypothetical protein